MLPNRRPANDPRTVARDIPGIFDVLFPQLTPGVVAHFNSMSYRAHHCEIVPFDVIEASSLQKAMLFELAVSVAEQLIQGHEEVDWKACLEVAVVKQQRHFDAKLPAALTESDQTAAMCVAKNLVTMILQTQAGTGEALVFSPPIPGYQWIASGVGDFALGTKLVEIKCSNKHFSSSDYRQVVMYWLLAMASAVENGTSEWKDCVLINPRLNLIFASTFDAIVRIIGAGRSQVEILELFSSMIGDHAFRMLASI